MRPISAPEVVQERREFAKAYNRSLVRDVNAEPSMARTEVNLRQERTERIVNRPDLTIPVGEEFVHLAQ